MKKRIAYDMSAVIWHALLTGKDTENGWAAEHEGKPVWINSAWHGYDIALTMMINTLKEFRLTPINMIMVFEGTNPKSKRVLIDAGYKQGRSHPEDSYGEFLKCKAMLEKTWLELGAQALIQDYAEGDDVLAWLAKNTEDDLIVATYDNDIPALNGTNEHGAKIEVWVNGMTGFNKYGLFDFPLITTYKALVGDTTDKIKGCIGFGESAFEKFCEQYEYSGLAELHELLAASDLSPLAEMADEMNGKKPAHPLVKKIFDQAPQVIKSFDLARMRPEWVDTMRAPLQWKAGMVRQLTDEDRDPRLKPWYGSIRLITADNVEAAIRWATPLINESEEVALDIETSSADESDEWLAAQGDPDGVDVFGSTLTGLGLTFGKNNQYTCYFSVDHADTNNISSERMRQFIASIPRRIPLVIQNVSFELAVLFNEWADRQMDNGYEGFLPNVLDTKFEANYVNENVSSGLKQRSFSTLGYTQVTYDEVTRITGPVDELPPGGRVLIEHEAVEAKPGVQATGPGPYTNEGEATVVPLFDEVGEPVWDIKPVEAVPATQTRRYKMNELTAGHVLEYGADDTICTIALHNYYKLFMQLEHSYKVYLQVEIDAAYQHAHSFIQGVDISVEKINELALIDTGTYDRSWAVVRQYLIEKGWEGTTPPSYTVDITPAQVKEAFETVTGRAMDTKMRTISKLATFATKNEDAPIFGALLQEMVDAKKGLDEAIAALPAPPEGEPAPSKASLIFSGVIDPGVPRRVQAAEQNFTEYVQHFFKGEPQFNDGSPKQMQHLMYTVMGLPIRVRNKATDNMRAAGIYEGTPKTDQLAIAYALQECAETEKAVLQALNLMGMVGTRRSLYYSKYPYFQHWKDGRVRSQHNQCGTNTRRASESKPNKQQLPKHKKIEGQDARFREAIVPHHPDAVIVSIDFKAQELRIIADYSQDPTMLSMYIGENKRDQHSLTGLAIAQRIQPEASWSYEAFEGARADKANPQFAFAFETRALGKKLNFTAEYGAMAPKVAATLMISEEDAQAYLEAREAMFPEVQVWKEETIQEAKLKGFVTTMLGAVRHLRDAFNSGDRWESSKAERQSVNFRIQSSSAEQTKLAEGRIWQRRLSFRYDAIFIGPIHDELVWSVMIADLPKFIPELHACMVAPYANMQVPIEGDISFGPDFYNQTEIGPVPSAEAIAAGLVKMREAQAKREAKRAELLAA